MKRRAIPPSLRFMVLERDQFACRYCGAKAPEVRLHIDHVVSIKNGGTNSPANLVAACQDCNLGKGALHLEDGPDDLRERALAATMMEVAFAKFGAGLPLDCWTDFYGLSKALGFDPSLVEMVDAAVDVRDLLRRIDRRWGFPSDLSHLGGQP